MSTRTMAECINSSLPITDGAYYGGVLAPGFDVTFDGENEKSVEDDEEN